MIRVTLTLPIRLAVIEVEQIRVTRDRSAYERLEARAGEYAEKYAGTAPGDVPGVQAARSLFRALAVDPTKTRPSSEALLRRAIKGKPLWSVNTLVDVGNWCSLDFLLPLGLFDRAKLVGPVVLREGSAGERYVGIAEKDVHVEGRYVLADDVGPFGSPVTDSLRTSITETTTEAVMMILAPPDYDLELLASHAATAAERMVEICGGATVSTAILDAAKR